MIVSVLFCVLSIFISNVSGADSCCPTGNVLLKRKDVCWDPELNVTSPIVMKCDKTYRFKNFSIIEDGRLKMDIEFEHFNTYDQSLFCSSNTTIRSDVEMRNVSQVVLLCVRDGPRQLNHHVQAYSMIVSLIFLIPTTFIYTVLSELRDAQGKSISNFCTSLAMVQSMLIVMKLLDYTDVIFCTTAGFLTYFFVMASFFWTNAISIQLLMKIRQPTSEDYSLRSFRWYSLYSWGCPTILTICAVALVNSEPRNKTISGELGYCWFLEAKQQWYYMYSIISLILIINISIFMYISSILWRQPFSTNLSRALSFKFLMTVRLIFLMGLPWVFEMVESLAGEHYVWFLVDIFNCLQGILIFFLLVVCRRRVIKVMYQHGWLYYIQGHVEKHLAIENDQESIQFSVMQNDVNA